MQNALRIFRLTLALSLATSTLLFVFWSLRWPLVGDATIIHYIAFLIEHGMAPYRVVHEMSMPGSYLIEMAAIWAFGPGALAWRLFDFTLLTVAGISFAMLTRRAGWLPAAFAAALFALVHGRDGLAQGGQRDLTMGVLLVAATAAVAIAVRRRSPAAMAAFGVLAGIVLTIKPTAAPLSLAQLVIALYAMHKREAPLAKPLAAAGLGMLVGPAIALVFLIQQHAVEAFWATLHGLIPYYASLGHKPIGFLLLHSISPLLPLVLIWFAVLALARPRLDWERALLFAGVLFGLVSYVVQARGFPYYRYPLLAFLLPLMALDFAEAVPLLQYHALIRKWASVLAFIGLAVGGLFLAPQSALLIHRYRWWQADFNTTLEQNLNRLGGKRLSGSIQCIDSISGCTTTLLKMQLLPASGIVVDFPLFGADNQPVVQQARADFRDKIFQHPPQVIVVSSALYVDGPGDYKKLERWPELTAFLAANYQLDTDWHPTRTMRWWSREELGPSYRIYVRKTATLLRAHPGNQSFVRKSETPRGGSPEAFL
jgi:hypothetical protein